MVEIPLPLQGVWVLTLVGVDPHAMQISPKKPKPKNKKPINKMVIL